MYIAKYLLNQDLDEFVVPTLAEDWSSMLDDISYVGVERDRIASYSFRNRFFPLGFPNIADEASVNIQDDPKESIHRVAQKSKPLPNYHNCIKLY